MINSEKQFEKEMKTMIRKVINGNSPISESHTRDELEVAAECLERGYLFPSGTHILDENGKVRRDLDYLPILHINKEIVPLRGLSFLQPDKSERRSIAALLISIIAMIISLLSNADTIIRNIQNILTYLRDVA